MIERPIPQDILKSESKLLFNLSARQLLFGGIGLGVGAFMCFGPCAKVSDTTIRAMVSFLPALPFFLIGFIKIYGQPFEKLFLPVVTDNFINPIIRKKEIHLREEIPKKKIKIKPSRKFKSYR